MILGVKTIKGRTFHVCRNLKKILLPEDLEKIEYFGIAGCTSLEELNLPDSITELQKAAIARNLLLRTVNIPKGLRHIPEYCIMGCPNLSELDIPDNIQTIGDKAFSLSGIKSIRLPNGVKIEPSILDGCKNLKEIIIGDQVVVHIDEKKKFEGLHREENLEKGQDTWYVSYSDNKGDIYMQEIEGVMSIESKRHQRDITKNVGREYIIEPKPDEQSKDISQLAEQRQKALLGSCKIKEELMLESSQKVSLDTREMMQELEQDNEGHNNYGE